MANGDDLFSGLTDQDLIGASASGGTPTLAGSDYLNVNASLTGLTDQDLVSAGIAPSSGILGNIGSWITGNPGAALTVGAGLGGLGMAIAGQDQQQQVLGQLQQQETGAQTMATALQAPLFSGVLPPGAQAAVTQAQQQGAAKISSSYASMGMAGSTGEADAQRANVQAAQAMQFSIAQNLFSQASNYSKMATSDITAILTEQRAEDQEFTNALGNFVKALAGGGGGGSGGGQQTADNSSSPINSFMQDVFGIGD